MKKERDNLVLSLFFASTGARNFIVKISPLLFISCSAFAQMTMMETGDMRLVSYDVGHKFILQHTARCFNNALHFHEQLFDYRPSEKITLLIQDFGDFGNGGATGVPKNAISMGLSPFSYTFETSPAGERIFSMMNHELVHVVALDNSSRTDRFYHKVFLGKVVPTKDNPLTAFYSYLTSPRRYSPRWYHEGIASYVETWMGGGVGLGMGSYDEMVFRTRVLNNAHIYSAQGLESEGTTTDFQGKSNSYLYGTRFMGYLSYEYGPDRIIEWVKRKDGSRRSYSAQFRQVFGTSLNKKWSDWISFERGWQKKNIEHLQGVPVTEPQPITKKRLGSVSYAHFDKKRNKIYVAVNYPGNVPHLAAINLKDGSLERLTDIKGAALFYVSSVAYDPDGDLIFFTTDNDAWRDLNEYDLKTGKTRRLQKDVRTGDLAFNKKDQSVWGIKHLDGYSSIVRIPRENPDDPTHPYSSWQLRYLLPYGSDIFDIDISPDGHKLSAAVSDLRGNQSLLIFDVDSLMEKKVQADTVFNFEISSPQSFRFTDDGKEMYGSSYYSGVSNIFKVDVASKDISPMSNAVTGLFRPVKIDDSKLFAFHFTSEGFEPVYIPNKVVDSVRSIQFLGNVTLQKRPELKKWNITDTQNSQTDMKSLGVVDGKYEARKQMQVNYAYPILTGYKNFIGLGYTINLSDPLNFRELEISAAYTPINWVNGIASKSDSSNLVMEKEEQYHGHISAKLGKYSFTASHNQTNFYDIFGPTKTSRKGTNARLDYSESLIYDAPRKLDLNVGLAGFYGLQKSPFFQQIETTGFADSLFISLDATLSYSNLRNSLGAVDPEKGVRALLRPMSAFSNGNVYANLIGSFDIGFQLPVNHFSVWFRTAAGNSFSEQFNPFTRFGFAAFGNNYVDYQVARRYRNVFSFPGLSYDANASIIARTFGKAMVEFVLPPIRFRELGGLNLYSNWMQATLFTSGLVTHDPTTANNRFLNVGSQVDMKIVIFSLLESTFSVGYANAFDLSNGNRKYSEWMISLKLLR